MAQYTIAGGEGSNSNHTIDDLLGVVNELENKMKDGLQRTIYFEEEIKISKNERDVMRVLNQKLEKENEELKNKVKLNLTESLEVNIMKEKSEEILTRAKSIIFEKTKVCKNQELQIEALTQQVVSLKEVVSITKDLLEIRNMEVKHLQDQINIMAQKVDTEKKRQDVVHEKLDKMMTLNSELKGEYQTQLCLFNVLRQRYSENELAKGILTKPVEVTASENTEERKEKISVQNGTVQTEVSIAPEPNKILKNVESIIPEANQMVENGNSSIDSDISTGETSEAESVGLSTIEENSSSADLS